MAPRRRDAWEDVRGAAADRASGAAEIAHRAAEAVAALPKHDVSRAAALLVRSHPSMAPLWRLATECLSARDHVSAAADFARRLADEPGAAAAVAAPMLAGTLVIHSYSGTVIAAVAASGASALCGRSEPEGEGARTARELSAAGVDARVVDDAEAVRAARNGTTVVVGADAVGPGGLVNKQGTSALARAAARCLVLAGTTKFVGADLPAPRPFERTSLDLVTAVVTEEGLLEGEAIRAAALRHPVHPALADELRR